MPIPIPPALVERLKALGETGEWIFHARGGVPLNPGDALKRYIRPVANELKIDLGGWHARRRSRTFCARTLSPAAIIRALVLLNPAGKGGKGNFSELGSELTSEGDGDHGLQVLPRF
jgi:hypothetical protein